MAKDIYRIPFSINVRRIEAPVKLQVGEISISNGHFKLYVVILAVLMMFLIPFIVALNPFIWSLGIGSAITMLLGWWWLWFLILYPQSNGEDGYKWILPVILFWLTGKKRQVQTRGDGELTAVEDILRIEEIREDGRILFTDGWFGYVFKVDGYASNMLFADERARTLDAFENFLRTSPVEVSISIPTDFAPMKLDIQREISSHTVESQTRSDLRALAHWRQSMIGDVLEKSFQTITQWMLISCPSEEVLNDRIRYLYEQVQEGLARNVEQCDGPEAKRLISSIYRP